MAGNIGIPEGGQVCRGSSLMSSDGIKAGWVVHAVGRGCTECQPGPPLGLKSQGPQEVLRVHGVSCNMAGKEWSRPGLSKTEENGLSPGAAELWILLWRKSDLDVMSVFCSGRTLRAAEIYCVTVLEARSKKSESLN